MNQDIENIPKRFFFQSMFSSTFISIPIFLSKTIPLVCFDYNIRTDNEITKATKFIQPKNK